MVHSATLLLTRPRNASERFAKKVIETVGALRIVISPLMDIEFLDIASAPDCDTVVFTSLNGVEAWKRGKFPTQCECFCVGEATASAARNLGFEPIVSGGTVEHLLSDIRNAAPKGQILHIHGRHTRGNLVAHLSAFGLDVQGLTVYEQRLLDLSADAKSVLQGGAPVIVPLFSPRSAAHFMNSGPFGSHVKVVAISNAAAEACPKAYVAPHPTADGMLVAISEVLNT